MSKENRLEKEGVVNNNICLRRVVRSTLNSILWDLKMRKSLGSWTKAVSVGLKMQRLPRAGLRRSV